MDPIFLTLPIITHFMPAFPFFSLAGLFRSAEFLCAKINFTLFITAPLATCSCRDRHLVPLSFLGTKGRAQAPRTAPGMCTGDSEPWTSVRHIFFLSSLRGQKLCLCEECQKREAAWEKLQIAAATRQVGGDMEKKGSPLT